MKTAKTTSQDLSIHSNILSRVRIPHPAYDLALEELQHCYDSVGETDFPQCLHLVGPSRAGKTCVVKEFLKKYPPVRKDDGVYMPVVYAEIPPTGTIVGVMENLLYALGDPHWSRGSNSNKLARVKEGLQKCGCRMVVLDELQHLADKGQNLRLKQTRDWLKAMVGSNEWALVVCGLDTSRVVITQDKQLKARFDAPIEIPRFEWTDDVLYTQFLGVLGGFQDGLAPFSFPDMQDEAVALRFYLASGGLIGLVVKLLQRAIKNAIKDNRTAIGLPELEVAFRRAINFSANIPVNQGPFTSKLLDTPLDERREFAVKMALAEDEITESVPKAAQTLHATKTTTSKAKPKPKQHSNVTKKEAKRQLAEAFA